MGIVPASVEMIVRGWWLCRSFESNGEIAPAKAKLTSMLMLAHLIATSGNLLKTGVIFGMNPLALNWAQMLALPPVTLAWISETLKRNRSIRRQVGRGVDKHVPVHAEAPRVITAIEDPVSRPFEARVGDIRVGLCPSVWLRYASPLPMRSHRSANSSVS